MTFTSLDSVPTHNEIGDGVRRRWRAFCARERGTAGQDTKSQEGD